MFVDQAKIQVIGGDGGDGCMAFRREKFVPRGGPSGGDGGKGGAVYFRATGHLNTLLSFRYQQHYRAERGGHGQGSKRHGKDGQDLIVEVPVGTQVRDEQTQEILADFTADGQLELMAQGGRGGRGNAAFASSTNQAPRRADPGQPGEEKTLLLELKILADVGLVGLPNAGKSTLISAISAARPKIGDYPFTTLTPNLGVVAYGRYNSFVVADIPGLIEGAHRGQGLGDHFLRHVERTRLLTHLIDVSDASTADPVEAYETVIRELELYDASLLQKPMLVVASKSDAADPAKLDRLFAFCQAHHLVCLKVSAHSGEGIAELKDILGRQLGVTRD